MRLVSKSRNDATPVLLALIPIDMNNILFQQATTLHC